MALIPALTLAVSLPTLQTVTRSLPGASRHWLTALGTFALVVACVALLQTQPIGSRVDRAIARVLRRVAMACNPTASAAHDDGGIGCLLTPQVLRAPVFPYDQQTAAVSSLTQACSARKAGRFWFVEGDSGSGKTRTALRFVQSLIRDHELFELGSRCLLYDFGESPSKQDKLRRQLGSPQHDDAVILVDNFQLVHAHVLRALTDHLIHSGAPGPERIMVFLTRPADVWNLSHGSNVRLLSEAKAESRHLKLTGPSSEEVARRVSDIDEVASQLIHDLEEHFVASAAQLHLAQVVVRNRAAPAEVLATLCLLAGHVEDVTSPELIDVMALVTALSVHRGTFARRDVRRAIRAVARASTASPSLLHRLRMRATFRRLHKVGLVPKIQLGGTRYIFHEAIAELCIDRLWAAPAFREPFVAVGRPQLQQLAVREKFRAWLVAAEIGDQEALLATFDAALSQGAYLRMTRCLKRARTRYELSGPTRLQLGILLNRTGKFIESRAEFTSDLLEALKSSDDLAAMLATSRMEATHDTDAEADLDVLARHPDRFVAIVGEYWQRHMAAHRGDFDAQAMLDLANEALKLLGNRESYWLTYSLARMHFDSLRHHYLMGGEPLAAVGAAERRRATIYLRDRLATFEALHMLYTKAHVVGFVLLPRLAIFGEPASAEDAALAGIAPEEAASVDGLVKAMQRLYRQTADEFWQYGDREAQYLRADILNSEMIEQGVLLEEFREPLRQYRLFGEANFKLVRSYPHFYHLRWHMLKHYAALFDVRADADGTPEADLEQAQQHLEWVIHFDSEARNDYGVMRARLLGVLLRAVREPLAQCERELLELQPRMAERGYGFEVKLIGHLLERDGITPEELRSIFRFYPFVHQ